MGCYKLTYDYEPTLFLESDAEKSYSVDLKVWSNPDTTFGGAGAIVLTQGGPPPFAFGPGSDSWNTASNYMTGIGMAVDGAAFSLGRSLDKRLAYEFTKTGYEGFKVKTPSVNFRTPFGAVRASTGFVKGAANVLKTGGAVLGGIGILMTLDEIGSGQKNIIGEGGLDLFMGGVAFIPGGGWVVSGLYFGGKWALEASGNDFWNK